MYTWLLIRTCLYVSFRVYVYVWVCFVRACACGPVVGSSSSRFGVVISRAAPVALNTKGVCVSGGVKLPWCAQVWCVMFVCLKPLFVCSCGGIRDQSSQRRFFPPLCLFNPLQHHTPRYSEATNSTHAHSYSSILTQNTSIHTEHTHTHVHKHTHIPSLSAPHAYFLVLYEVIK